jgi:hypothetical protein
LAAAEGVRQYRRSTHGISPLGHQLARRGTCALVVPIFDGAGLDDLRFSDLKEETLSADGYQRFAGPTRVCEVARGDIVAGRGLDDDTYRQGRMWYARPGVHLRLTGD